MCFLRNIAWVLFLSGIQASETTLNQEIEMKKIETAVENFNELIKAHNTRDLDTLRKLCSNEIVMWGTAEDEETTSVDKVVELFSREFDQSKSSIIEVAQYLSPNNSQDAYCAAVCNVRVETLDGTIIEVNNFRASMFFKKEEGQWRATCIHCSFPDPRNTPGDAFPTVK